MFVSRNLMAQIVGDIRCKLAHSHTFTPHTLLYKSGNKTSAFCFVFKFGCFFGRVLFVFLVPEYFIENDQIASEPQKYTTTQTILFFCVFQLACIYLYMFNLGHESNSPSQSELNLHFARTNSHPYKHS